MELKVTLPHRSSGFFIFTIQKQKKGVAMAKLVARCYHKANQLLSMQGFGMQRAHKINFKPKKHKKVLTLVNGYYQKTNQHQFPLQGTYPDDLVNICGQVLNVKYTQNHPHVKFEFHPASNF